MSRSGRYCLILLVVAGVTAFSCNDCARKEQIEQALKKYDRLILQKNADSIAMMYSTNGDLGTIAHGRDSIRKFLSGFANVKVLSVSSTSENIFINGDTALQSGRFNQVALMNGDTLRPTGTYVAKWIWIKGEGWRIRYMVTMAE